MALPDYDTLGSMITNRLGQFEQNELARQQVKNALIKNKYAEPMAQEELAQAKQKSALYTPMTQADIAQKQANTNRLNFQNENPLYGQAGMAGQVGAAELLRNNPQLAKNPNALNLIEQAMSGGLANQQAQTALHQKQAAGYDFNSLPVGSKEYLLAQTAGMGIDPVEGRKLLASGKSLEQIAVENGYDPNNLPEPVYPLTKAGQTAFKNRQAANEEIKALSSKISDASKSYSRKLFGQSPKLILEALQGKNKEGQAKALAARALQPELAAIRLRMGGGNVGIEAIREMTDTSMGHLKVIDGMVSPEVYEKAQKYVDEWLTEAVEAANKKATQGIATKKSTGGNLVSEASKVTPQSEKNNIMTYNPKTGRLE